MLPHGSVTTQTTGMHQRAHDSCKGRTSKSAFVCCGFGWLLFRWNSKSAHDQFTPTISAHLFKTVVQQSAECHVREHAEWKNETEGSILLLLHPSAGNKDHNCQARHQGALNMSEIQIVEDNDTPALSLTELNVCSEPLCIQEKLCHWHVEPSQSCL